MPHIRKHNVLLASSGLIGVSVVSVLTFLTLSALSSRLVFAVYCFSVAIPALAGSIVLVSDEEDKPIEAKASHLLMFFAGTFLAFVGIAAMFLHLRTWAGIVFIICAIAAAATISSTAVRR